LLKKGIALVRGLSYISSNKKRKVMSERKIISQIASSNADFHPIIRESKLSIEDKLYLQDALVELFNNDFRAMINDMLEHAIEMEEYETAIVIRDELDKVDKNG
jgi:hypothetical protein